MTLPLIIQTFLKDANLHKLTLALTYTLPLKLENQTDISKYSTYSVSMITLSDPNASHTCILTAIMF